MIITLTKLRELVPSAVNVNDSTLQDMLEGLESLIRDYTNNNFQARNKRTNCVIENGVLNLNGYPYIATGDTIEISKSFLNNGLYTYANNLQLVGDDTGLVTKVEYPAAIQNGVANMIRWDIDNRPKAGIQSESLSRHSVTYFNQDGDNSSIGYPKSLVGFLKPYMKARF